MKSEIHINKMTNITDKYQNSERWLRLVTLIDHAGTVLCKKILHDIEGLPTDGGELYCRLRDYEDAMQFDDQKKIICPSNKKTDESKFDITTYTSLIQAMFKGKHKDLIHDLRNNRNHLYHMANKDMPEWNFEKEWSNAYVMLQRHGFRETVHDLKNGNLPSGEKLRKILNSLERQFQGSI